MTEPIARLAVEGGYDSNVLYDGAGGSGMGRVSPDVGLRAHAPLWDARLAYGGEFLTYAATPTRPAQSAINHRGLFKLDAQPRSRLRLKADVEGSYAIDPVGLARLGLFAAPGQQALVLRGTTRATWRAGRRLSLAFTYDERDVRLGGGLGAGAHTPGVEASWKLGERSELGGTYRFDVFQTFDPRFGGSSRAHELKALYKYQLDRKLEFQAEAGPALWMGGGFQRLLPEFSARLIWQWREGAARVAFTHGVGLGSIAEPGLSDGIEGAVTRQLSRSWRIHAEGGVWHGSDVLGQNSVWGYSAIGEIAYLLTRDTEIALGLSRFARLDDPSPQLRRSVVGLRVSWHLPERH